VLRRLPRVRVAPRAVDSDGEDAAYLAARYGLAPDEWQEDVLSDWLGRRRDGRWSASTCGLAVPRQNGKNAIIEMRELYGMAILGERILHTAHEVKTARKAFLRILSFFENERQFPELAGLVPAEGGVRKTNGQEAILLRNGGGIEFIARSRSSGRGFTVDVLVCDEAQDLNDEVLAALLPTISAAPLGNPQVIMTGTPPDPEKLTQGEVFRRVRVDGEGRRDQHLAWSDFGAEDGALPDCDDRALWTICNPALGIRLSTNEVERERSLMADETFARERLGWWGDPNQAAGIFGDAWRSAAIESASLEGKPALAIAATYELSHSCIGAAVSDGGVFTVKPVAHGRGTAWVVDEALELQAEHDCQFLIDGKGPAASMIPQLDEAGVRLKIVNLAEVIEACALVTDSVHGGRLHHMHNPVLDTAVAGAQWRPVGDRRVFGRKNGTDITPLEAVTLATWGVSQELNYDLLDSFG